ncbi:hypothetical protein FQN53_004890 [Emmonsiellopsis sp. PD_33]|nr:hypothetical protein FQN53_004890 [Emmonsiellopsis sp. PD_33]
MTTNHHPNNNLPPPRPQIRSCTLCRYRKVKCDRQQPCGNCARLDASKCIYPPGPGRAPKRPRRRDVLETRLLERLASLEDIMRRLEGGRRQEEGMGMDMGNVGDDEDDEDEGEGVISIGSGSGSGGSITTTTTAASSSNQPVEQQIGRLVIDETRSCYVSNVLWARLGDEVEELRDLLYEPPAEDEDSPPTEGSGTDYSVLPLGQGANAAIMGFRALTHSLDHYHPQLAQSVALLEKYKENVAPLVPIFHMPTLIRMYWDAIGSMDSLDKNTETLLFAIYYSAAISMDTPRCLEILGIPRETALERYRFATEQAMARANLLESQSMILLQAAVLFLTALRNEDSSRVVWSLSSLIFHIAQAMGLHRDGSAFGLRPLETELRRRLWWHICLLDNRSSEYHGCEPIVRESAFDTKMPLNVNDSDLTADMKEPPAEREGVTDVTFCLIRCHALRVAWKIGFAPASNEPSSQQKAMDEGLSLQEREALIKSLQHHLEDKYLKYCVSCTPFAFASVTIARLIIARMWLTVHYPRSSRNNQIQNQDQNQALKDIHGIPTPPPTISPTIPPSPTPTLPRTLRDSLFLTSIDILQMSSIFNTNKSVNRWMWHCKSNFQWHAVAIVLSEICSRPPSPDCERAWEYVSLICQQWEMTGGERKATLWRPVRRLMAKARYVREMQRNAGWQGRVAGGEENGDGNGRLWEAAADYWVSGTSSSSSPSSAGGMACYPPPIREISMEAIPTPSLPTFPESELAAAYSTSVGAENQMSYYPSSILPMEMMEPFLEMFPDGERGQGDDVFGGMVGSLS